MNNLHEIKNVSGNSFKCIWCGCYFAESQVLVFSTCECPSPLSGQMQLELGID